MQCLSSRDQLISFSIMCTVLAPAFAWVRILFLFKANISLYEIFTLFIYFSIDGQLGCFQLLAIVRNAAMMSMVVTYIFFSIGDFLLDFEN